jgi:hypothetical protein
MDTTQLFSALDTALPDEKIVCDILGWLEQNSVSGNIQIELDDEVINVPTSTGVEIVTKTLLKEYTDAGFSTYRVEVSIGKIVEQKHGIITPQYCFATLHYDKSKLLITIDLHREFR